MRCSNVELVILGEAKGTLKGIEEALWMHDADDGDDDEEEKNDRAGDDATDSGSGGGVG